MFQNARLLPWDNVLRNVGLGLNKKDWRQKAEKGEAEKVQQLASTH
ncbi:aliphatic sulfonates import ATP-binding protein SsuB (plasmid) [Cylindrospermum sp. NIES-4074]|nr:aliphatic sulfonates import ATP-binding protein SsuB [Cylindrospermum sp. NIES-4074]